MERKNLLDINLLDIINVDLPYICIFRLLVPVLVVPARLIKILQDWYKHIAIHNEQKTLNFQ